MLNMSRGKEVIVQLKNDRQFVGTLRAFDIHINVVLDNTKEMHNGQQIRTWVWCSCAAILLFISRLLTLLSCCYLHNDIVFGDFRIKFRVPSPRP